MQHSIEDKYCLNKLKRILAVVLGERGDVNVTQYQVIADALTTENEQYCRIKFTSLEYDSSNGSSMYSSLKNARQTFEDTHIAVAIGPQIDVFTSTEYVILHQIHFVTSLGLINEESARALPILPDQKSLSKAIASIVSYLEWNKVAFLSQEDFSPVIALGGKKVFVSPIRLPTDIRSAKNPQLTQTLTTLRESQMDKFILHSMKRDVVKYVLLAAQDLHLLHHSIRWLITYLDFEDVSKEIIGMAKVYGLQLFDNSSFPHKTNAYSGSLDNYIWPKLGMDQSTNVRNDYSIDLLRYTGENDLLRLAEVSFQTKKDIRISTFAAKEEPKVTEPFKDKYFTVIAKLDEPFVMVKGTDKHGAKIYDGFCVDVLNELSKELNNFKYEIIEADEDRLKQLSSSARGIKAGKSLTIWDDITNQLIIGNASMAIGAFAVTADRESQISFSYTIISSSVSLLLTRPPDSTNYFQFLGPFSWQLWLLIVGFVLTVGLGLFVMAKFDSTLNGSENQKFELKESMWYTLTVLLQGSSEYAPQTTSMRTIVAFFWFCTLVINAAYTANLAAFLTLQQIDDRIKSVDHLARQTKVKYGVLNNSDLMQFFENSRDDPYERMWAFMKLNEDVSILSERKVGVSFVLEKDNYAYIDDGVINDYSAQKNCKLESIQQNFGVKHFGMGFPKGAPYLGDINLALLKLKEHRILDSLREKWWSAESNCSTEATKTKVNTASELNISNMFGVFIVLIGFTVLAVLYELCVVVWTFIRKQQSKKMVIII
ncbi:glutamate receptor ionotropic, kainate 3-like [Dreissena polymorpha]|uniref:glutamate receptor ionotropic, kainate 3-like n=1 Tax=Dreissena polymorpha TaxID=45954 RepID=UPI0022647D22|nr:glutamate receptor ionotropic, kainate 3-like [Dreissena polymorpha]